MYIILYVYGFVCINVFCFCVDFRVSYDLLHVNTLNFILGPIQLNLIEYVQIDDYTYMVL